MHNANADFHLLSHGWQAEVSLCLMGKSCLDGGNISSRSVKGEITGVCRKWKIAQTYSSTNHTDYMVHA